MRRWGLILTSDDVTTPAGMSTAPAWLGAWTFCFRPVWKAPRCLVSSCRAWWRLRGKTLAGCAAASPLSWNHPWGYSLHFFFSPSGIFRPLCRGGADLWWRFCAISVTQLCLLGDRTGEETLGRRVLRWIWGVIITSISETELVVDVKISLTSIRIKHQKQVVGNKFYNQTTLSKKILKGILVFN